MRKVCPAEATDSDKRKKSRLLVSDSLVSTRNSDSDESRLRRSCARDEKEGISSCAILKPEPEPRGGHQDKDLALPGEGHLESKKDRF